MILQRYILRELLASFLFAFTVVLSVCLVGTMLQVFRTFPGLGFTIFMKALPLATGAMATWVILVASCTAGTLVYARLAAENEITAMRMCGIHTARILAPAVLLGLMLVGAAYPLNTIVVPWARHNRRLIFRDSTLQLLKIPPPGNQDFKIGTIRFSYLDYQDGRMKSPTVSRYNKDNQLVMEYFAPSGTIIADPPLRVVLSKPHGRQIDSKGREEDFQAESDVTIQLDPDKPEDVKRQPIDLPQEELWDLLNSSRTKGKSRNQIILFLNTRYAASFAPLLLVLVAVPIGILVRKGSRLAGLGAALPPLLMYFVAFFIFQGLGDKGRVSPLVASWAPDALLGVLSAALLSVTVRK